jgi:phosphohistidine phosphatase
MNIYLVRHGPAVDVGTQGVSTDEGRMLSADGRAKTAAAARGLRCMPDVFISRIASSPLLRARETAALFAKELGVRHKLEVLPGLAPGGSLTAVTTWLTGQPPGDIALVGHMPDIADLASVLACSNGAANVVFKKAAVLCLEFDGPALAGAGRFVWLMQPGTLRLLGDK